MILALSIIGSLITVVVLASRLHEARERIRQLERENDAYRNRFTVLAVAGLMSQWEKEDESALRGTGLAGSARMG